jgi:hypothetical protein
MAFHRSSVRARSRGTTASIVVVGRDPAPFHLADLILGEGRHALVMQPAILQEAIVGLESVTDPEPVPCALRRRVPPDVEEHQVGPTVEEHVGDAKRVRVAQPLLDALALFADVAGLRLVLDDQKRLAEVIVTI